VKRKYHGLTRIIVIIICLVIMAGYGFYRTGKKSNIKLSYPPPIPDVQIPDKATMERVTALSKRLYRLANMSADRTPITLKLFGYEPVDQKRGKNVTPTNITVPRTDFTYYYLSLCFSSEKNSFCVIDNTLYALNSFLPGNERIIKIEHDRVLIKKNSVKDWIYLSRKKEATLPEKEKI